MAEETMEQAWEHLENGKKFSTDLAEIDDDLIGHAQLYGSAASWYARAAERRDAAKFQVTVLAAQLDKDIRDQLVADGEKVTEDKVKALVILEPEYQKAVRRLHKAEQWVNNWDGMKESYKQRSYMIKEFIQLRSFDYTGERLGNSRYDAVQRSLDRRGVRQ